MQWHIWCYGWLLTTTVCLWFATWDSHGRFMAITAMGSQRWQRICGEWQFISNGKGTVLWILEDTNLNNCLRGECFVPGHDNNHSKFTGSYLLLLFVHHACPAHTIQKCTLQVACNGKLVLFCLWNLTTTAPDSLRSYQKIILYVPSVPEPFFIAPPSL